MNVIIPVGADPHDFAPSARQAASLREADLVVTSGHGLEAGLADALEAAQEVYGVAFRAESGRLLVDDAAHRTCVDRQSQDHVRTRPGLGTVPE